MVEDIDGTLDAYITKSFINAVDTAQERGFATTGGTDEGGDDALLDVEVDIEQCLKCAIPEI